MPPILNLILYIIGLVLLAIAAFISPRGINAFAGGVFFVAVVLFVYLIDQGQFSGAT